MFSMSIPRARIRPEMELATQIGKRRSWFIAMALVLIAVPLYQRSMRRTKERLLENNRFAMRVAMDEYIFDKQRAPRAMQDLVDAGYLKSVPIDPFTGKKLSVQIPSR